MGNSNVDQDSMIKHLMKNNEKMALVNDCNESIENEEEIKSIHENDNLIHYYKFENIWTSIQNYNQIIVKFNMEKTGDLLGILRKFEQNFNFIKVCILCMINADNCGWGEIERFRDRLLKDQIRLADVIIYNSNHDYENKKELDQEESIDNYSLIHEISILNPVANIIKTRLSIMNSIDCSSFRNTVIKSLFQEGEKNYSNSNYHQINDSESNNDDEHLNFKILECEQAMPTIMDFEKWYQSFLKDNSSSKMIMRTKAIIDTVESGLFFCQSFYDWYEITLIDEKKYPNISNGKKTIIACLFCTES